MMGEELNATYVTQRGLLGDRAYALIDSTDGKVVSAKNPRKWGSLFDFQASFVEPPRPGGPLPPVRIGLPDGTVVETLQPNVNRMISDVLGREVSLEMCCEPGKEEVVETTSPNPWMKSPELEEYWPDIEGLAYTDAVTDEKIAAGTFFDAAVVHLLTTATLDRLRELYPQGRFEARRFRPNIIVGTNSTGFVENDWIGKTVQIGDEVRIEVFRPCGRCVMTTLPQGDLPRDPGILRTAVQQNQQNVGVYCSVVRGGTIRRGDQVRVD
jgi:uncharacterized protein YcbX